MSEDNEPIVFVIDDDAAFRDSMQRLFESVGLKIKAYASAEPFLQEYPPDQPGCLLLDIKMPGGSDLALQQQLAKRDIHLPVVVVTACGDVTTAVAAMKNGALDFIEKPCNEQQLLDCVQNALARDQADREAYRKRRILNQRFASLTPREREVMERVVQGLSNKEIADVLAVSRKTIEVHRAKVMEKMQTASLSELIQMAIIVGILKEYVESGEIN